MNRLDHGLAADQRSDGKVPSVFNSFEAYGTTLRVLLWEIGYNGLSFRNETIMEWIK